MLPVQTHESQFLDVRRQGSLHDFLGVTCLQNLEVLSGRGFAKVSGTTRLLLPVVQRMTAFYLCSATDLYFSAPPSKASTNVASTVLLVTRPRAGFASSPVTTSAGGGGRGATKASGLVASDLLFRRESQHNLVSDSPGQSYQT